MSVVITVAIVFRHPSGPAGPPPAPSAPPFRSCAFSGERAMPGVDRLGWEQPFGVRREPAGQRSFRQDKLLVRHHQIANPQLFLQISNSDFSSFLPTDLDHIKTENARNSDPQTVLIWFKSACKIGQKSTFEIRKKVTDSQFGGAAPVSHFRKK